MSVMTTSAEPGHAGPTSRARLLDLSVGLVEDLRHGEAWRDKSAEDFCDVFQVCLPYRGLFVWHVGDDEVVGDANQVVFVRSGESFRMSNPVGGYAELIVTPSVETLSEIACPTGTPLSEHPLFRRRCAPAHAALQALRARFRQWAAGAQEESDALEAEEHVLALLRSALFDTGGRQAPYGARTGRLIRRTKEFLAAELSGRITLVDIGRAVGASPAYLTDLFRRVEGLPLHQYLTRLRLARALAELSHTDDITGLALDAGFSSHSHFTFAFRRAFGCTPSRFRETTRRDRDRAPIAAEARSASVA